MNGGLPQFDITLFPSQLFWLAISFGLLYVMMAFVALPGVSRAQARRREIIESELRTATRASEAAKAMMAQYEKALADARAQAQETVSGIAILAASEAARQQAAQQQQLTSRLQEAESKIGAARDAALREVRGAATELATAVIEKITGERARVA